MGELSLLDVWTQWPGTSEPQKYEALVDTGAQCTLIPSGHVRAEPVYCWGDRGITADDPVGS